MSTPVIRMRDYHKTFYVGFLRRPFQAARGISFEVEPGEIFGFLGPNGAGKTTTIKALLGLIKPDKGELSVLGHPSASMGWRNQVGYLPEHPSFYEFLTGFELVTWFARLAGASRHQAELEAKKQLERLGLSHAMNRRIRGYSKGMLQRAGLAQALVGEPKVLILDEPMTGLDPIGRKEMRELIRELRSEGRTIFYSTHILPDVEMTCDRVGIVHRGKISAVGHIETILGNTTKSVSVRFSGLPAARLEGLKGRYVVTRVGDGYSQLELPDAEAARALVAQEQAHGAVLEAFEPHREDLESLFIRTLGPEARSTSQEAPRS